MVLVRKCFLFSRWDRRPRLHEGGGHPVGVGAGVGVGKAPRVGGHRHIQRRGHLLIQPPSSWARAQISSPQAALSGSTQVFWAKNSWLGWWSMARSIRPPCTPPRWGAASSRWPRPRSPPCPAHSPPGHTVPPGIPERIRVASRLSSKPGGFPQPPQQLRQRHGAADGVPVGALVGENQVVVVLPQKAGGVLAVHSSSSSSPPSSTMCSLAGIGRLHHVGVPEQLQDVGAMADGVVLLKDQLRGIAQVQPPPQLPPEVARGGFQPLHHLGGGGTCPAWTRGPWPSADRRWSPPR